MTFFLDVKLALSQSIPQFDRTVTRTRDDLSVIRAEADAQHIRGVADEAARRCSGVQVPQTESVVP